MSIYNRAKIYKLCSDEGDEVYIGSTTQSLNERLKGHKCQLNCTSKILFEKYTDVRIELILDYPHETKQELFLKEGEYIRNTPNCINRCIAGRSKKEYNEDNKDKLSQQHKEWYENNKNKNKEHKKEYMEIYRRENPNKKKQWYENNKDRIKEYQKQYNQKNKDKINEQRRQNYQCKKALPNPQEFIKITTKL